MIRFFKWAGLVAALTVIISCFLPWIYVESRQLEITGMQTTGTNFGKPGYLHLILAAAFLLLHFIPVLWAKRVNLLVAALNIAWAIRNYFLITSCNFGECPEKEAAIFLVLLGSALMMVAALFPDMKPVEGGKERGQ